MPSRRHRARRLPPLNLGQSPRAAEEPTPAETEPEADKSAAAAAPDDAVANRAERRGLPADLAHGLQPHVGRQNGRPAVSRQAFRHRSR